MTKLLKVSKRRKGQSASKARLERDAARYAFLRSRAESGACIGIWKETEGGNVIKTDGCVAETQIVSLMPPCVLTRLHNDLTNAKTMWSMNMTEQHFILRDATT